MSKEKVCVLCKSVIKETAKVCHSCSNDIDYDFSKDIKIESKVTSWYSTGEKIFGSILICVLGYIVFGISFHFFGTAAAVLVIIISLAVLGAIFTSKGFVIEDSCPVSNN